MPERVRLATAEDVTALLRLNAEVQALHAELSPELFLAKADETAAAAYFAEAINKPGSAIGLYPAQGEPLGYIWIE